MSTPLSAAVDPCRETPFHTEDFATAENLVVDCVAGEGTLLAAPLGEVGALLASHEVPLHHGRHEREGGGAMRQSMIIYFAPILGGARAFTAPLL